MTAPRGPKAWRMTYMGPPHSSPRAFFCRKRTASKHSAYVSAMPVRAVSSIHTRAPGPPAVSAVATPTMFPVPMVAARAVISEANGESAPGLDAFRASRPRAQARA